MPRSQAGEHKGPPRGLQQVLVVEESLLVAMEIEEELTARGFAVQLAGSLGAADERIRNGLFAAALLDCYLPDGHALDIALRLSERGCPVAIVSGAAVDALPAGFELFPRFQKPVPARSLAQWVIDAVQPGPAPAPSAAPFSRP